MEREEKINKFRRKLWKPFALLLMLLCVTFGSVRVSAATYASDYRYWSQGGSDYYGMRQVGCLITAQAKLLYETNVIRDAGFNPDAWYNWLLSRGFIASSSDLNMRDHNAPAVLATERGKDLSYLGYWKASEDQFWFNINAGYYTIVNVSGHFVMIDNALSKQTGTLWCYDSFNDRGSVEQKPLSRYSTWLGGHVYRSNNNVEHSHSYTGSITRQPTCTASGVKTFTCSCGASYTEAVPARGHRYKLEIVPPTTTQKGYTLHTCENNCGHSYKDNYVDALEQNSDGWYYCDRVPSEVTSDSDYEVQYRNYYEVIQKESPGGGWTNAGVVKNEWQNSGAPYDSEADLPTSAARVLVRTVYYHFCGPNTGDQGNYSQTGSFVHYDGVAADQVIASCVGNDNGHPYYLLDWRNGSGRVWCQSGITCDGSYGSHGNRCQAWYKMNTYQNRVQILEYKYTKTSDWTSVKDSSASSVQIRFKNKKSGEITTPTTPTRPSVQQPDSISQANTFVLKLNKNSFKYNGKAQKPKVRVLIGGKKIPSSYYSVSYTNNKKVGTATVSVKGKKKYRGYSGKAVYKITPPSAAVSKLKSTGRGRLSVKWKSVKEVTGYQVLYSTNKKFKSGNRTVNVTGRKKSGVTLKKLRSKKNYYVKLRTYKRTGGEIYFSSWSKTVRVKIK